MIGEGFKTCENAVCTRSARARMLCSDRGAVRGVLGATLTGPSPLAFKRTANLLEMIYYILLFICEWDGLNSI